MGGVDFTAQVRLCNIMHLIPPSPPNHVDYRTDPPLPTHPPQAGQARVCKITYAPMIYMALCVVILMRACTV